MEYLWFLSKKQNVYIKSMITQQVKKTCKSNTNSDSKSDGKDAVVWTKGLNSVQQMYITLEYKRNNGYGCEDDVTHIDPDELRSLKKKDKKGEKYMKKHWEVYA